MSVREMIRIKLATARSKALYDGFLDRADQARQDARRDARLRRPECRACFYLMAPPERASGNCAGCNGLLAFNEAFCSRCAAHRSVCRRCGADLEFKKRGVK